MDSFFYPTCGSKNIWYKPVRKENETPKLVDQSEKKMDTSKEDLVEFLTSKILELNTEEFAELSEALDDNDILLKYNTDSWCRDTAHNPNWDYDPSERTIIKFQHDGQKGSKIPAIVIARKYTDLGLKEAWDAVEKGSFEVDRHKKNEVLKEMHKIGYYDAYGDDYYD